MVEASSGSAYGPVFRHGPGEDCRCIVSPGCLREVRRRQMVPLEAVMEVSGYSREYLSALERGDGDACVVPDVLRVYEQAMGIAVEQEVLTMIGEFLQVMQSGHEMLTRLYWFRVRNVPQGRPS